MNGKPNTKHCAARPCDAGRTGLDPAENGPAPHEKLSAYARKMLIDGYIVHMDTSDIRAQTAELQKSASMSIRLPGVSTAPGLCTRRTLRTSKGRWQRYGSYKDTSYQVNAEKGAGLHREPGQDRGQMLVSSFGCSYETADIEFEMLLAQAIQKGNNLAHHLIQSFAPGEATPEQAHEIGKQLATKCCKANTPMY